MTKPITRRQAFGYGGAAGIALVGAGLLPAGLGGLQATPALAASACATLTPELTEGPYWVDLDLHRSDVTANTTNAASKPGAVQDGVPLTLTIEVLNAANGCAPLNGAHVDIWQANAYGLYSDEASQQAGGGSSAGDTTGQNYLRGFQVTGTDSGTDGQVVFKTIWPGWYSGRAIHIHVRVRAYDTAGDVVTNYTTQIFFTDATNDAVLSSASPYDSRSPAGDPTTDENDNVLASYDYATNVTTVSGSNDAGYAAAFTIMLSGPADSTTGSSTTALNASCGSVTVIRGPHGARRLTANLRTNEQVTVRARLQRAGKTIAGAHGHLTKGVHSLKLTIPKHVAAGQATLVLTVSDSHGHTRTITRRAHVPARL